MRTPQEIITKVKQLPARVKYVVGIDEVGRGSLAGPMMLGVCSVTRESFVARAMKDKQELVHELEQIPGLADSKKLSAHKRQNILNSLAILPNHISIEMWNTKVSANVIDKVGIRQSYLRLLKRVTQKYDPAETLFLLDYGIPIPNSFQYYKSIKKGDATVPAIALASIYAKVARDKYMQTTLHGRYPQYGWDKNVGYGTSFHRTQIMKHGSCKHHRHSWIK